MERFRNLFIREKVIKVPNQMEALRIMNYPYQAIEEAVVNAFYHRDYMSCEPVTILFAISSIAYNGKLTSQSSFLKSAIDVRTDISGENFSR